MLSIRIIRKIYKIKFKASNNRQYSNIEKKLKYKFLTNNLCKMKESIKRLSFNNKYKWIYRTKR